MDLQVYRDCLVYLHNFIFYTYTFNLLTLRHGSILVARAIMLPRSVGSSLPLPFRSNRKLTATTDTTWYKYQRRVVTTFCWISKAYIRPRK